MIRKLLGRGREAAEQRRPPTKLVVGLGNVGPKYAETRHNLGFMTVDQLVRRRNLSSSRQRMDAVIFEQLGGDTRIVFAKPVTMMNNSGYSVAQIVRWYKVAPADLLVIYDELDVAFGKLRVRAQGGPGGHNGIKSVIEQIGSSDFARIRVGIGRPTSGSTVNFVLSRFRVEERAIVPDVIRLAADAADTWIEHGTDAAMNEFNTKQIETRSLRASD